MADVNPPSSTAATAGSFEPPPPGQSNGGGNAAHMPPPPPPPVMIPANTNPIPTSINSPMSGNSMTSPNSVRRAAPEPNKRALYVGGLDPRVTDDVLRQIFETTGNVLNVKIIPDKNKNIEDPFKIQSKGLNYGFVEYDDPGAAERAMQTLNGRRIHQQEIRVNWAYQSNNTNKEDTSHHFHLFVGDLSNEVTDEVLLQAFSAFGGVSEARVMWDMKTGRSRGYGFVAFRDRKDAETALENMDREWLGSRPIRCNWANQKGQPSLSQQASMGAMGVNPNPFGHHQYPTNGMESLQMILQQTPEWQTTAYVGNLTPYTSHHDILPLFHNYGHVEEIRFQADRGFGFVKMETHHACAVAICNLNGFMVNGRPLKCSWGKDRPSQGQADYSPGPSDPNSAYPPSTPSAYFPQYSAPPNPMSPQGGYPGGHFQGSQGGYGGGPGMPPQQAYPPMNPGSAGGYGRGGNAGNYNNANAGNYHNANAGSYNNANAGHYNNANAGPYNANAGHYNNANAGPYNANAGPYNANAGHYNANAGQYGGQYGGY